MAMWSKQEAAVFALCVSGFAFLCNVMAPLGPQLQLAIGHFVVGSKFVLTMAATAIPAIVCVVFFKEARRSLLRLRASWHLYAISLLVGITLPLSAYVGSHSSASPFQEGSGFALLRVMMMNLFLSPLWEEVIWRGTLLNKLNTAVGSLTALIFSSFGWLLGHVGYFFYLYKEGIDTALILLLIPIVFCSGIVFAVLFESTRPRTTIWPSVVLHASFNASTLVYYRGFGRLSERSSYIAEDIFVCIAAVIAVTWLSKFRGACRGTTLNVVRET